MANTVSVSTSSGTEERELQTSFAIKVDEQYRYPPVVNQVEVESNSDQSTTSDMCGNTRRENFGSDGLQYTVRGIATFSSRERNLSVPDLLSLSEGDNVEIRTDFKRDGFVKVSNVVCTQTQNLNGVRIPGETDGTENAVEFQIQLGKEESQ